jgi:hypothetical protein
LFYIIEDHSVELNMGGTRIENIDFENTAEKWSARAPGKENKHDSMYVELDIHKRLCYRIMMDKKGGWSSKAVSKVSVGVLSGVVAVLFMV